MKSSQRNCQWNDVCLFVTQLGINITYRKTYALKLYNRILFLAKSIHIPRDGNSYNNITMIFPNVLRRLMPYAYTLITENRDGFITYNIIEIHI